jgi:(2Fe-2S) ferredoxin
MTVGPPFRLHVVACDGTSCRDRGSRDTLRTLRGAIVELDLIDEVRLTTCTCLDLCAQGPNLVVYPDGVWYSGLSPRKVRRIVAEHLAGGTAVADLALDWSTVEGKELDLDAL